MMGHHARSEALFYHTQLSPAFSAAQQNSTFDLYKGALWRALLPFSRQRGPPTDGRRNGEIPRLLSRRFTIDWLVAS